MPVIRALVRLFLAPGDIVRQRLGITIEQDGGMIRSFINMCFWGVIALALVFKFQ